MKKILLSWCAYNNDFRFDTKDDKRHVIGFNADGPTFNVHKYFWSDYERHIILTSNLSQADLEDLDRLILELKKLYPEHAIESQQIRIFDVINVEEIFSKINDLIPKYKEHHIDVFISPGTPAMQTSWYLIGANYRENMTLFQVRGKQHTKDKKKPEKIIVGLDTSVLPKNLVTYSANIENLKEGNVFLSPTMKPQYELANKIAITNDIGCLILGENGTGKELLAKYIHNHSPRNKQKMITVNCAAFSDELLLSELFGHEKGAFTGALYKKEGVFKAADGGTVFLDEIGDITPKMQVSLLRVLQEKKIQPVGSNLELAIDVRVIAATNKNLEELCETGTFRWDLYYRIAITTLKLPALREHTRQEIKQFILHFNNVTSKTFSETGKLQITPEAMEYLLAYNYRGNIRELQNMFLQFYTFGMDKISISDLPQRVKENRFQPQSLDEAIRRHILMVYDQQKYNQQQTAKVLGIARETLRTKLKSYDVL